MREAIKMSDQDIAAKQCQEWRQYRLERLHEDNLGRDFYTLGRFEQKDRVAYNL